MKIDKVPLYQVNVLTSVAEQYIHQILTQQGLVYDISPVKLQESTAAFLRDIYKIDDQQQGSINLTKMAGYWGFWIRKLKPIIWAFNPGDGIEDEYTEINEYLGLHFAVHLMCGDLVKNYNELDTIRSACTNKECNKTNCIQDYIRKYFSFNGEQYSKYITYSMKYRTFGPHHFVALLDQLVFSACCDHLDH